MDPSRTNTTSYGEEGRTFPCSDATHSSTSSSSSYIIIIVLRSVFPISVSVFYALKDFPLTGMKGVVIGSQSPWVEVHALESGAEQVGYEKGVRNGALHHEISLETELFFWDNISLR